MRRLIKRLLRRRPAPASALAAAPRDVAYLLGVLAQNVDDARDLLDLAAETGWDDDEVEDLVTTLRGVARLASRTADMAQQVGALRREFDATREEIAALPETEVDW